MTTIRRFSCNDLLRFASVNLDHLTETFNMSFYMTYMARWPDYFHVAEAPGGHIMGYTNCILKGMKEGDFLKDDSLGPLFDAGWQRSYCKEWELGRIFACLKHSDSFLLQKEILGLDGCRPSFSYTSFDEVMGKVEGQGESWHGHVTAVTVAPEYRRQQLAKKLMNLLEEVSDKIDKAYFVDLFVRASNTPAIKMYEKLDYIIYRRVLRYYSGEEDGLDMRKALSRDVEKKSIIPLKRPVTPDELEYD